MQQYAGARQVEVRVIFTEEGEIRALNQRFLGRDEPTDVLAFDLGEKDLEGEIYISVPTAAIQAREYGTGFWEELSRLAAHGALHLVGFDDAAEEDRQQMRQLEDHFLARSQMPANKTGKEG